MILLYNSSIIGNQDDNQINQKSTETKGLKGIIKQKKVVRFTSEESENSEDSDSELGEIALNNQPSQVSSTNKCSDAIKNEGNLFYCKFLKLNK